MSLPCQLCEIFCHCFCQLSLVGERYLHAEKEVELEEEYKQVSTCLLRDDSLEGYINYLELKDACSWTTSSEFDQGLVFPCSL